MKWVKRILIVIVVLLVAAQLYRPKMTNPPVDERQTLRASGQVTPQVEAIFERSCNDCHSNQTVWPWYAKVAPASWLLASDVNEGRGELNFSTWASYPPDRKARKLKQICSEVREGEMPPELYLPLHPSAKISDADKQVICAWASNPPKGAGAPVPGAAPEPAEAKDDDRD